jgi:phage-related protein
MDKKARPVALHFYAESSGKEPVREWLLELDHESRKKIGQDIMVVQFRWPLGMPLVKHLGKGLWEVRSNIHNGTARVIFMFADEALILLHGFIKKTQKTPLREIELALARARTYNAKGRS